MSLKNYVSGASCAALLASSLVACVSAETMPEDFQVTYSGSSGPVAPQYWSSTTIEFGANANNIETYHSARQNRTTPFVVPPEILVNLYGRIHAAIRSNWWQELSPRPVGGAGCSLSVTMRGKDYRLPCSWWEVNPKYRDQLQQLISDIAALPPKHEQDQFDDPQPSVVLPAQQK